jgi:RNA polymerase sigma factor (sigma-70 family)
MNTACNDDDLILRAQRGEKEAYGLLVRAYMQPAYYSALALVGTHDEAQDPALEADRALLRDHVRAALGTLRTEEREFIVLRDFDGHSYAEIAELLECPLGTVMSRLYYARKHLKELLEDLS